MSLARQCRLLRSKGRFPRPFSLSSDIIVFDAVNVEKEYDEPDALNLEEYPSKDPKNETRRL